MSEAQNIHQGMFKKYWNGDNPIWDRWNIINCPPGRNKNDEIAGVVKIQELLDSGKKVKAGYATTGTRGFHTYYILWR